MLRKNCFCFVIFLFVVFLSACTQKYRTTSTTSTISKKTVKLGDDQYMVKSGDTLYSIAFDNGIDYRTLALINNIDLKSAIIHPGDILTVKIRNLNASNVYRVKSGDTLYAISRKFNVPLDKLIKNNNLVKPYGINVGQLLVLDKQKKIYTPSRSSNTNKKDSSNTSKEQQIVRNNDNTKKENNEQSKKEELSPKTTVVTNNKSIYDRMSKITWKWPTKGSVIHFYGQGSKSNKGIDIAGKKGQVVSAAASGKIVYAGNALRGYGNLIIIKHNDDYISAYAHNDQILVKEMQQVKAGQIIAKMGNTDSDCVNLHFEIRYRGDSVNPIQYLPKNK